MLRSVCAALALVLAAPSGAAARPPRSAPAAARKPERPAPAKRGQPSALERARAQLAAVQRDPARRRYRHHWERAIGALLEAARGRDAAPALLEAARARYALYRFSQVDADRSAALALAARARRAGARDAAPLAAAIRREMGEDERPPRRARASQAAASAEPAAPAEPPPPESATPAPESAMPSPERSAVAPPERSALEDALAAVAAAPRTTADSGPAVVSDVRTWSNADYTRVAIYLSRPVGFTREELPAASGRPRRLALDLAPARLDRALGRAVGDALVARVRTAQRDEDTVRVVLDLAGRDDLVLFALDDPPRLIVDVGVNEARREAQAEALRRPAPAPSRGSRAAASPERGARRLRRVVVDAGHGGHDTGAIGPTGVREKDVTLAMAKRLQRRLAASGFEVVLTRSDDRYVALEERTALANARRGDLFVSLHANAHPRRDQRGVETYVLDVADDRYARRLAARENGALDDGQEEGHDVRRILSDLDARASADSSRRLARAVQRELLAGIRGRVGEARDLGVKSAVFHVLVGARMPAVLVETAFISNRVEERRLASTRFQEEVAASVARAVEGFARGEARVAVVR